MAEIKIFVEDTAGNRFESEVPADTEIGKIAAEFFEAMQWAEQDSRGRGQRAVVELVYSSGKKTKTRRLRSEQTLEEAEVKSEDVLRIFPEAIAGVDPRLRRSALQADLRDVEDMCEDNDKITFKANKSFAPTEYVFTFYYRSFSHSPAPQQAPRIAKEHKVNVLLPAEYPLHAPIVTWETPIFHPNIRAKDRAVCLGQLMDRYLPGLGLTRIVSMLIEILQWRNFDIFGAFNLEAAKWAANPENWTYIRKIGGSPIQIPWAKLIDPSNWGDSEGKPVFAGIEQPKFLFIAWQKEKDRDPIKFNPLN